MSIGERLKSRLSELNMKQTELAEKLKISTSTLNGYFTDYREPDLKTLVKLADELDTNVEWIITGEGSPKRIKKSPPTLEEVEGDYIDLLKKQGLLSKDKNLLTDIEIKRMRKTIKIALDD